MDSGREGGPPSAPGSRRQTLRRRLSWTWSGGGVGAGGEAVHPARPLEAHDHAFHPRQQGQREGHAAGGQPERHGQRVRAPGDEGPVDERRHEVADDEDRQVSRAVIGAGRGQVGAAGGAGGPQLEIAAQDAPLPAGGAAAGEAAAQGRAERAVGARRGASGRLGHGRLRAAGCRRGGDTPGRPGAKAAARGCRWRSFAGTGPLAIKGLSIAEIAAVRQTRDGTIKAQCTAIYRKAGVTGRPQLISLFA